MGVPLSTCSRTRPLACTSALMARALVFSSGPKGDLRAETAGAVLYPFVAKATRDSIDRDFCWMFGGGGGDVDRERKGGGRRVYSVCAWP